ncbi:class I SAM-dependent methyltransferase [Arthrobacter sp. H5]|uniref:class I SAM-dependent methyltransferase n=1 Tax=Arthrobacter sp. H5 TaxID=1267973 RepID=UPI0004851BA5|nr:class I SAM-dependent methyltransferase [Arthrobacter sp. H5]
MTPPHAGVLFDQGAEHFERLAPALWNPMGNAVVAAADISLGEHVLDACCGSGSSTVPAAQSTGAEGKVDAVDLSRGLLDLAAKKAEAMNLAAVNFVEADASSWTAETQYDAVLCCYGLFFLPDMAAGTRHFASLLRPGGRLALSTWDEGAHAPFAALLKEACTLERPELEKATVAGPIRNMEAIGSAAKLRSWLTGHGFAAAHVDRAPLEVPLDHSLAWSLVLGSGYRAMLPATPDALERVRMTFLDSLGDGFVLNANSLIAVAELEQ